MAAVSDVFEYIEAFPQPNSVEFEKRSAQNGSRLSTEVCPVRPADNPLTNPGPVAQTSGPALMKPQITVPFAVPFGVSRMPDPERLNATLRSLFLERESLGAEYANPYPTMQTVNALFESRFDLFLWPEPCVRELREFCWNQLYQFIGDVNGIDGNMLSRLHGHADAWFHITRNRGYFALHNHPMASWSGVYCVDAGSEQSGGLLSFPDPNSSAAMFKDAANRNLPLPYGQITREFRLEPGQLILFPSWLMHQVTPFEGQGARVTVAFNTWFTLDSRTA